MNLLWRIKYEANNTITDISLYSITLDEVTRKSFTAWICHQFVVNVKKNMLSCRLLLPCMLYNALKETVVQLNILKWACLLKKESLLCIVLRCSNSFFSSTLFVTKDTLTICQGWIYLHSSWVFLNKCFLKEFNWQKINRYVKYQRKRTLPAFIVLKNCIRYFILTKVVF